jgi:hypothetical protein
MKTSKILLATLVGGIVFFLLGWLVYGILLMDFMQNNSQMVAGAEKDPPVWWALIVAHFLFALLLAVIYGRWASISTFATGAKAGAVIGIILSLGIDLFFYATMVGHTATTIIVDVIASVVIMAISGGVIAWVLGRGN